MRAGRTSHPNELVRIWPVDEYHAEAARAKSGWRYCSRSRSWLSSRAVHNRQMAELRRTVLLEPTCSGPGSGAFGERFAAIHVEKKAVRDRVVVGQERPNELGRFDAQRVGPDQVAVRRNAAAPVLQLRNERVILGADQLGQPALGNAAPRPQLAQPIPGAEAKLLCQRFRSSLGARVHEPVLSLLDGRLPPVRIDWSVMTFLGVIIPAPACWRSMIFSENRSLAPVTARDFSGSCSKAFLMLSPQWKRKSSAPRLASETFASTTLLSALTSIWTSL